jgi:hypothetical protein
VHLRVQAALARQLGHAQRSHRVRDDVGRRVVEEALFGKPVAQPFVERRPVAGVQLLARDPVLRILGMEVEREPGDLGAEPARDPLGRRLAEPAERSDVVRPDVHVDGHG